MNFIVVNYSPPKFIKTAIYAYYSRPLFDLNSSHSFIKLNIKFVLISQRSEFFIFVISDFLVIVIWKLEYLINAPVW